jgi:hypothetical protein
MYLQASHVAMGDSYGGHGFQKEAQLVMAQGGAQRFLWCYKRSMAHDGR